MLPLVVTLAVPWAYIEPRRVSAGSATTGEKLRPLYVIVPRSLLSKKLVPSATPAIDLAAERRKLAVATGGLFGQAKRSLNISMPPDLTAWARQRLVLGKLPVQTPPVAPIA